jgi:hypothetical protein
MRLEAAVDGHRLTGIIGEQNGLLKQLQQHLVEPGKLHNGAVIVLHELLDSQIMTLILMAELLGELALIIEQQPILAAPGQGMQGEAHLPEEVLAGR